MEGEEDAEQEENEEGWEGGRDGGQVGGGVVSLERERERGRPSGVVLASNPKVPLWDAVGACCCSWAGHPPCPYAAGDQVEGVTHGIHIPHPLNCPALPQLRRAIWYN